MKSESAGPVRQYGVRRLRQHLLVAQKEKRRRGQAVRHDAGLWLREIESGRLISSSTGANFNVPRRIVMTRCYGNPVPRRNSNDNSTDMNSFPFVRHHFLRAGFEVIDCPPLTAQLKNSADIRMVMDVRDVLNHDTRFDEFILLSRRRSTSRPCCIACAHARRTVVFANDHGGAVHGHRETAKCASPIHLIAPAAGRPH